MDVISDDTLKSHKKCYSPKCRFYIRKQKVLFYRRLNV